jgi:hypothetical protein
MKIVLLILSLLFANAAMADECALSVATSSGALTVALKTQSGADPAPAPNDCTEKFANDIGGYTLASVSAPTSLTIGAGSTLGFVNGVPGRLWEMALLDASGTVQLAVEKVTTPTRSWGIDQDAPQSTQACNACTNASVPGTIFSTTAQVKVAIRAIGYSTWEAGLITAGAWVPPTRTRLLQSGTPMPGTLTGDYNGMTCPPQTWTTNNTTSYLPTSATISLTPRSAAGLTSISYYGSATVLGSTAEVVVGLLRGGTLVGGSLGGYLAGQVAVLPTSQTLLDFPQVGGVPVSWSVGVRNSTTGSSNFGGQNLDGACGIAAAGIQP